METVAKAGRVAKVSHVAHPLATVAAQNAFTALSGMPDEYFAEVLAEFPQIDESALKVFLALRTATRRVENVVAQWLEPFDLTMTKLDVLHLLASRERRGASVSTLRDFLKMTQPNVTFVLQSLERQGFVRRKTSPEDRRVSVLFLTPAGRAHMRAYTPYHIESMNDALAGLSAEDRARLVESLATVAAGFERIQAAPTHD